VLCCLIGADNAGPLSNIEALTTKVLNSIELTATMNVNFSLGFSMAGMFAERRWPSTKDLYFRVNSFTADVAANVGPLDIGLNFGPLAVQLIGGVVNMSIGVTTIRPITLTMANLLNFSIGNAMEGAYKFRGGLVARLPINLNIQDEALKALLGNHTQLRHRPLL
jgi:hypothetical protein